MRRAPAHCAGGEQRAAAQAAAQAHPHGSSHSSGAHDELRGGEVGGRAAHVDGVAPLVDPAAQRSEWSGQAACKHPSQQPGQRPARGGAASPPRRSHRTQSIFMDAGKGSLSYWMAPKLSLMPRLRGERERGEQGAGRRNGDEDSSRPAAHCNCMPQAAAASRSFIPSPSPSTAAPF